MAHIIKMALTTKERELQELLGWRISSPIETLSQKQLVGIQEAGAQPAQKLFI